MGKESGGIINKTVLDGGDLLDRMEANIEQTEARITRNLEEIDERLTWDSVSKAARNRGAELLESKIQPAITEMGDAVKELVGKAVGNLKRDPLPVLLIGAGAGLILMSVLSSAQNKPVEARRPIEEIPESIAPVESVESKTESSPALPLALSALIVGAVVGGIIPGVDFEGAKVKQWKSDLLESAGRAGQEILNSTERMLRESFHLEQRGEQE